LLGPGWPVQTVLQGCHVLPSCSLPVLVIYSWSSMTVLSRLPVPAVLAILSSLSFPGWPVKADLSGRPVQTNLSRLPSPSCLVPDVLFVLLHSDVPSCPCWSSSGRPVLAVVGSDSLVLVFLPQLSCPGCPCPGWTVPGVLSHLSCPCCHVMSSVLCNRLYYRGCTATVVPSWWSWPSCRVLAVMFKTSCPLFHVLLYYP
jgi:hypothetical protein